MLGTLLIGAMSARACPDVRAANSLGVCMTNGGSYAGRGAEQIKREFPRLSLGSALAGWLSASRNTVSGSSIPVPADVRSHLVGYIPDAVLNRPRYKVSDNGAFNVAPVIQ